MTNTGGTNPKHQLLAAERRQTVLRGTGGVLLREALEAVLPSATRYRRAAGYFSSSVFGIAPQLFANFFARGGRYELVTSPEWSLQDVRAVLSGAFEQQSYLGCSPETDRPVGSAVGPWLLAWAIANGRVHIKIAMPMHGEPRAIFHEKFGVVECDDDTRIAFDGSANESRGGYVSNYERLRIIVDQPSRRMNVQRGAEPSDHEVRRFEQDFDALWNDETLGLKVLDFWEATRLGRIQLRPSAAAVGARPTDRETLLPLPPALDALLRPNNSSTASTTITMPITLRDVGEVFVPPARLELRDYQKDAIRAWFANGGRGTLAMATGTGKTITALSLAHKVYAHSGGPLAIILVAPLLHLVDQWEREARAFGLMPVKCTGAVPSWEQQLRSSVFALNEGGRPLMSAVVTLATFCTDRFQQLLAQLRVRTLLIVDEVHNAGSSAAFRAMPEKVTLRLGLSATPERWMDQTGTDRIAHYFGKTVFEFGIREALQHQPPILTPYFYYPILIHLEDDEAEEYSTLTTAIGRSLVTSEVAELGDVTLRLLVKRARLIASARQKLPHLRKLIAPFTESAHTLVYCGDGSVDPLRGAEADVDADDSISRQIDAVARLLGRDLRMRVNSYTADTPLDERERLRRDFERGELQALVAIRCLDEGLDIPSIQRAFILASSTNPKQFIQRRGRILRRAPGKERADVYDFIVVPPPISPDASEPERRGMSGLIEREFRRVMEFARDARNRAEAESTLFPILKAWNLLHL